MSSNPMHGQTLHWSFFWWLKLLLSMNCVFRLRWCHFHIITELCFYVRQGSEDIWLYYENLSETSGSSIPSHITEYCPLPRACCPIVKIWWPALLQIQNVLKFTLTYFPSTNKSCILQHICWVVMNFDFFSQNIHISCHWTLGANHKPLTVFWDLCSKIPGCWLFMLLTTLRLSNHNRHYLSVTTWTQA